MQELQSQVNKTAYCSFACLETNRQPRTLILCNSPAYKDQYRNKDIMSEKNKLQANTFFIEVEGAGMPEVDGLFVPSLAPPTKSESGTLSSLGYWNGKMAWDRADGKSERSPSISYSNSYCSWRISRLDGHLAYDLVCDDEMPPIDREWHVYKKGVAPATKITIHHYDPREACPKPNVVFVIGGPGAGKGTMCELAESQLGWTHLSMGELLRKEREVGGETAATIEKYITAGELVPNEITVTLLQNTMERITRSTGKNNFLLDGFPRSLDNMDGWYEIFGEAAELPKMLYLECPYAVLEKRILGRAKYSDRSDDNIESMKLRFDTFKAKTLPTVEFFKNKNKCIEIDSGRDRESVYKDVVASLAEHTDQQYINKPLSERAEVLLGLRPHPKP